MSRVANGHPSGGEAVHQARSAHSGPDASEDETETGHVPTGHFPVGPSKLLLPTMLIRCDPTEPKVISHSSVSHGVAGRFPGRSPEVAKYLRSMADEPMFETRPGDPGHDKMPGKYCRQGIQSL